MAKVLYVEDDPIQRDVIAQILELDGFEADVAADGLEGVEKAMAWMPDLILTDLQMPRMSGFEVISRIRSMAATARIPIISMSGRLEDDFKRRALDAGANVHFSKPVNIKELIPQINACLTNG